MAALAGAGGLPALRRLEAIGIRYQDIRIAGFVVPVQFMQALPYILTVIILAGFVGKAIPPKAGGRPYVKER